MLYAGVHVIFQLLVFIDFDDVTRIESQQRLALQETADLVTFIEEILNGKLHLLWSVRARSSQTKSFSIDYDFAYISADHKTRFK